MVINSITEITLQKKQGSDKVFKKTFFAGRCISKFIYWWNILYHKKKIKSKHFLKNAVVEIAVRHRSEKSFYVLDKIWLSKMSKKSYSCWSQVKFYLKMLAHSAFRSRRFYKWNCQFSKASSIRLPLGLHLGLTGRVSLQHPQILNWIGQIYAYDLWPVCNSNECPTTKYLLFWPL